MSEKQEVPSYPVPQAVPQVQGAPGVAPNVINVIPAANIGQQYRDQCKFLSSSLVELGVLTTRQCLRYVRKVNMKGRRSMACVVSSLPL